MEDMKFLSWISSDTVAGQRKNKKQKKRGHEDLVGHNQVVEKTTKRKEKRKKKRDSTPLEEGAEKKKKKRRKREVEDHVLFVQSENMECAHGESCHVAAVSKKKPKKKKVTFSLPKHFIGAKRPQITSTLPRENVDVGTSVAVDPVDSPACSEDFNSQDLFITQKKFRTSPELESPEGPEESDELLRNTDLHKGRRGEVMLPKVKLSSGHWLKSSMKQEDGRQARYLRCSSAFPQTWSPSPAPPPDQSGRTNSSTQTENFFTTELSSYLRFCRERADRSRLRSCRPLDLRLSHRARNRNQHQNVSSLWPTSSSEMEVKNEQQELELSQHSCLQSEFESKPVDNSMSSEDSAAKPDLSQVHLVQTRLNESFFFKNKAEPMMDRPESPLMKLSQVPNPKKQKRH